MLPFTKLYRVEDNRLPKNDSMIVVVNAIIRVILNVALSEINETEIYINIYNII